MHPVPKPKKFKKPSRKRLVKRLDEIVSQIVRKRDKKCVTCGSVKQLGCGHIFSRAHYSTRWDLDNCHAQCWVCNYKARWSDTIFYPEWYREKFGEKKFLKLYEKWKTITHYKDSDLNVLLEALKGKLSK